MKLERAIEWRWTPAVILAAAFLVRAGWGLSRPDAFRFPDSHRYWAVTRNVVEGRGLVFSKGHPSRGREYIAHSDPGYSVFLAGLYYIGLDSARAVRLVQALLGTATVWLAMLLAGRMFGRATALASGAVTAFEPHLVFFTGLVLTETLFTFLLVLSLVLFVRARDPSPGEGPLLAAAGWGAASGVAALVRSTFLLFLPLVTAADVIVARPSERRPRLGRHFLALGVFLALLAPWTVRNALRLGAFVPGSTRLGIALYDAFGPDAFHGRYFERHDWPEEELAPLGEIERDRYLRRRSLERVLAHPGKAAGLAFVKLARLWSPVPWAAGYRTAFYWTVGILAFALLVVAAGVGCWLGGREWRSWWPALAPAAYLTMLTFVFAGSVRYRVPVHAGLAVLAGAAYAVLLNRIHAGEGDGDEQEKG